MSEVQKNRGIRSLAGDFATFNSPVLYKNPNPAPDTLDDVEYNTYFGWKCSKEGDKSFVWFSQKNVDGTSNTINVSEENCQ